MHKKILILIVVLIVTLMVGTTVVNAEKEVRSLIIGSGGAGGSWYLLAAQLGEVIQDELNIPVTVVEGGAISNVRLTNEGRDMDIGITSLPNVMQALKGEGTFAEDNINNVSPMINFATDYVQFAVLSNSDINNFADLKDKRILPGPKGWGIEALTQEVLGLYGISYEDLEENGGSVSYVSWGEAPSLLKDHHADMAAFKGIYPNAHIMEIEATNKAKVLGLDEEQVDQFIGNHIGYFKGTIPAGTYKGQDEPALTIGHTSVIAVNNDLPDDVINKIVNILLDNAEKFNNIEGINIGEDPLLGIDKDMLHPGAKAAYEEKGIL